jgi:hypothetical protein
MASLTSRFGSRKSVPSVEPVTVQCVNGEPTYEEEAPELWSLTVWMAGDCSGKLSLAKPGGELDREFALEPQKFEFSNYEDSGEDILIIAHRSSDSPKQLREHLWFPDYKQLHLLRDYLQKQTAGKVTVEDDNSEESDIGVYGSHVDSPGSDILRSFDDEGNRAPIQHLEAANTIARALFAERYVNPAQEVPCRRFETVEGRLLSQTSCRALVRLLDEAHAERRETDTKIVMILSELEAIVGSRSCRALRQALGARVDQVKLRRVEPTPTGDIINFHLDHAKKTLGVALNDNYDGSSLLYAIPGEGIVRRERKSGVATVHDNTVPHGVTALTRGVRYGLFLLHHEN